MAQAISRKEKIRKEVEELQKQIELKKKKLAKINQKQICINSDSSVLTTRKLQHKKINRNDPIIYKESVPISDSFSHPNFTNNVILTPLSNVPLEEPYISETKLNQSLKYTVDMKCISECKSFNDNADCDDDYFQDSMTEVFADISTQLFVPGPPVLNTIIHNTCKENSISPSIVHANNIQSSICFDDLLSSDSSSSETNTMINSIVATELNSIDTSYCTKNKNSCKLDNFEESISNDEFASSFPLSTLSTEHLPEIKIKPGCKRKIEINADLNTTKPPKCVSSASCEKQNSPKSCQNLSEDLNLHCSNSVHDSNNNVLSHVNEISSKSVNNYDLPNSEKQSDFHDHLSPRSSPSNHSDEHNIKCVTSVTLNSAKDNVPNFDHMVDDNAFTSYQDFDPTSECHSSSPFKSKDDDPENQSSSLPMDLQSCNLTISLSPIHQTVLPDFTDHISKDNVDNESYDSKVLGDVRESENNDIILKRNKRPLTVYRSQMPVITDSQDLSDDESENPAVFRFTLDMTCKECLKKGIMNDSCQASTSWQNQFSVDGLGEMDSLVDGANMDSLSNGITDYTWALSQFDNCTFTNPEFQSQPPEELEKPCDITVSVPNIPNSSFVFYKSQNVMSDLYKSPVHEVILSVMNYSLFITCVFKDFIIVFQDSTNENKWLPAFVYNFGCNELKSYLSVHNGIDMFIIAIVRIKNQLQLNLFHFNEECHTPKPQIVNNYMDIRNCDDEIHMCALNNLMKYVTVCTSNVDSYVKFNELMKFEEDVEYMMVPLADFISTVPILSICSIYRNSDFILGLGDEVLCLWHSENKEIFFQVQLEPSDFKIGSKLAFVFLDPNRNFIVVSCAEDEMGHVIAQLFLLDIEKPAIVLLQTYVHSHSKHHVPNDFSRFGNTKACVDFENSILFLLCQGCCFLFDIQCQEPIANIVSSNVSTFFVRHSVLVFGCSNGIVYIIHYRKENNC